MDEINNDLEDDVAPFFENDPTHRYSQLSGK